MSSKIESRRQSLIIVILIVLLIVTNVANGFALFSDNSTREVSTSVLTLGTVDCSGSVYQVGTNAENVGSRSPVDIDFTDAKDLLPGHTGLYTLKLSIRSTITTCLRMKVVFELQLAANGAQYSEYTFIDDEGNTQNFINLEVGNYNTGNSTFTSNVQSGSTTKTLGNWSRPDTNGSEWIYYNNILPAASTNSPDVYYIDFKLIVNEKFGSRMSVNSDNGTQAIANLINRSYKIKIYVATIQADVASGEFGWDEYFLPSGWYDLLFPTE